MIVDSGAREYVQAHFSAPPIFVFSHRGVIRCCQTNRLKHQKPGEHTFYEATNECHSVRAASRFSLKLVRVESDLCELK